MEEEKEADPAEGKHPASPEEELNDQVGGNCIIACIHEYPLLCLVHVHVLVLLIRNIVKVYLVAVYLQYITDYTYGTGKKKCNNIPTPILSFSLPHWFPWWKPRALVCGRADMPQNYSKANTFLFPSTLPSTVEIQGALCAEVMACHNISTPLHCVPFRSV